ncbi:putative RNA methyltransferase [Marinomonas algicola]|uniref:putative RNA methyltransferase n=1 Tax=Marinomonas algicola TaxID=2773454 RepID=UPI001749A537|nr:methyltransferase domain-containing protein [Marinomonas algicola]
MPTSNTLLCPLDKQPLTLESRSLKCASGHGFDLAKSGYVNLLPVQNKRSKDPGDSKEMVASRKSFLELGHYQPIADCIVSYVLDRFSPAKSLRLFDAGCGEGYYLNYLESACIEKNYDTDLIGLDISKWAIMAASKSNKSIQWVVGSNADIPLGNGSLEVVTCLFGFPMFTEFSRVLSQNGILLLVDAGAEHLIELRKILYSNIHDYEDGLATGINGFSLIDEQNLKFTFGLQSPQEIQNLLSMTPHIHKAPYSGKEALKKIEKLDLTADVKLRWYVKNTVISESD